MSRNINETERRHTNTHTNKMSWTLLIEHSESSILQTKRNWSDSQMRRPNAYSRDPFRGNLLLSFDFICREKKRLEMRFDCSVIMRTRAPKMHFDHKRSFQWFSCLQYTIDAEKKPPRAINLLKQKKNTRGACCRVHGAQTFTCTPKNSNAALWKLLAANGI